MVYTSQKLCLFFIF